MTHVREEPGRRMSDCLEIRLAISSRSPNFLLWLPFCCPTHIIRLSGARQTRWRPHSSAPTHNPTRSEDAQPAYLQEWQGRKRL